MRCPECKAITDPSSAFCSTCGLILLKVKNPQRRREDHAQEKRRSVDLLEEECRFCNGHVRADAVRCVHCGQILKDEVVREMMRRRRAQINYASWVAYILGLFVLLIFKPVGILAIGAGLILSIVYYALPADPTRLDSESFLQTFKRQMKIERVAVPIPALKSMKLIFIGTPMLAALAGYFANYILLQRPMNQILAENSSYHGMKVSTHYQYWVIPGVLVYDLKELNAELDPLHVHTALLQFAHNMRSRTYERVELKFRGKERLQVDGETFRRVGVEYGKKNFNFAMFEVAKSAQPVDPTAELKKSGAPNEALVDFHKIWYANEELARLSRQRADAAMLAR